MLESQTYQTVVCVIMKDVLQANLTGISIFFVY